MLFKLGWSPKTYNRANSKAYYRGKLLSVLAEYKGISLVKQLVES